MMTPSHAFLRRDLLAATALAALVGCGSSSPASTTPTGPTGGDGEPPAAAGTSCDEACTTATACAEKIGEPAHGSDCVSACEELPPDEQAAETARWAAVDAGDDEACRAALGG